MYSVKIGNKKIGYIDNKEYLNNYIEEFKNDKENVAFVNAKEEVETSIKLVNRNTQDNDIKQDIYENLSVEYTTYAVVYNSNNIAYLSNMEEAENVINDIKGNNNSDETKELSILQVYSDNYEEIKAINSEEANTKIAEAIKTEEDKKSVKLASTTNKNTASKKSTIHQVE